MLKRIKATARQLREFAFGLISRGADTTTLEPLLIKVQIPRQWFTKKHTLSRVLEAKRVFGAFTAEQQEYAINRGWFPRHWKPRTVFTFDPNSAMRLDKRIHEGNTGTRS